MGQQLSDQYLVKQLEDWNRLSRKEWVGYAAEAFITTVSADPELLAKIVACGQDEFILQACRPEGFGQHGFTHDDLASIFEKIRRAYIYSAAFQPGARHG